ncbi:MAG TPA: carbamoyl phosphate synthase small subunit [Candidatus Omnitrophica bacterium]|nr:carbamoyl phosphate synthase small subunit [Candidatus Omnitrophota bacterium]HCI44727.1 carbamoyl phosphate synthase small subunit [Candidatus Omnitrophota bacterium]
MAKAILYLEDGTAFEGQAISSDGESAGEVVFNTAMTGYQEILTDPSYAGQIVVMTYPLIGNYGVNDEDAESGHIYVKGFVVKEFCRHHSNYRATRSLIDYLQENKILAIEGVDTRALTRHLRVRGAMKAVISTKDFDPQSLERKLRALPSMEGSDWVKEVTVKKKYVWNASGDGGQGTGVRKEQATKYKVAAIDCGIKRNILRILESLGCEVHVFPAGAGVQDINAIHPDGLFISNGPGDPAAVTSVIETVRQCVGKLPIFGICLGHQILGLALGGKTYKLKFGHHGANHPVKDLLGNRIGITSQNHGFCVDMGSLSAADVEMVDMNLNDKTLEGMRHKKFPVLSFQHHPEAAPGPRDAQYLFRYFIEMMEHAKQKKS